MSALRPARSAPAAAKSPAWRVVGRAPAGPISAGHVLTPNTLSGNVIGMIVTAGANSSSEKTRNRTTTMV